MTDYSDMKHICSCDCGIDQDHVVVLRYWRAEKSFPSTMTISTGLNHYLPVWKRLLVAIKYVLGIDNTYCTYTGTSLSDESIKDLHCYLGQVIKDMEATSE